MMLLGDVTDYKHRLILIDVNNNSQLTKIVPYI